VDRSGQMAASDAAAGDWFGSSVSLSGDYAVIGSQKDGGKGSAYLFRRAADGTWTETQKFSAVDGSADDRFGSAVAVSGDIAVVGAFLADGVNADSGKAYFFNIGHKVSENSPTDTYVGTLSGLDVDDGETYTFSLVDDANGGFRINGNVLLVADGSQLDFETAASLDIIVRVTDSDGKTFDQTITIYIADVNDAPAAIDGTLTISEDADGGETLSASDEDLNPLTYSIVNNGIRGTAVITDPATGAYTYTPDANANGTDTFTFKVNDGLADSNTATITVTINPVIDGSTTSVTGSLDPSKFGQTVTFTANSDERCRHTHRNSGIQGRRHGLHRGDIPWHRRA